jgi:hypothetical protein
MLIGFRYGSEGIDRSNASVVNFVIVMVDIAELTATMISLG